MSNLIDHNVPNPNMDDVDVPIDGTLEDYVQTAGFDDECREKALTLPNSSSDEGIRPEVEKVWSSNESASSATTVEPSPYDVSDVEANLYYAGVGPKGRGPKLIYRTSADVFEAPSGPEAYKRLMRIVAVPNDYEFGSQITWEGVRDQVVILLDKREIKVTTVDFVRFSWLNKHADREIEDDEDGEDNDDDDDDEAQGEDVLNYEDIPLIQSVEYGDRHFTNPTIWIGVSPNTLTSGVAHDSSKDIRCFLDSLNIQNIDIAYRESIYKPLASHGPALFPPVEDGDSLKDIIDNVSVALSIPIAGRKTTMQGTLGPYFHVGDKLYAITARHNLFVVNTAGTEDTDNDEYRYHDSTPKREVMIMSALAFNNYLASIQALIGTLIDSIEGFNKQIAKFEGQVLDGINVVDSQKKLDENKTALANTYIKIRDLKSFFVNIKKKWSKDKERVIGFVRWAPPIGVGIAPHRYTRDICVIELYKEKFKSMIGNVLSLGPEMPAAKMKSLIYERVDVSSEFKYPDNGILVLRGTLTADQINRPTSLNPQGNLVHHVIKRGFATNTTIGTITRFMSFVRQYFKTRNRESVEIPILSHEQDMGSFAAHGDSGSLIVSPTGEFVALLTGGTYRGTDTFDITYATLFEWIWDLVKAEFPGANLYFNDLHEFFADVA